VSVRESEEVSMGIIIEQRLSVKPEVVQFQSSARRLKLDERKSKKQVIQNGYDITITSYETIFTHIII
jgi:hypothetical protein